MYKKVCLLLDFGFCLLVSSSFIKSTGIYESRNVYPQKISDVANNLPLIITFKLGFHFALKKHAFTLGSFPRVEIQ